MSTWLVLFLSKFSILEAVDFVFSDHVELGKGGRIKWQDDERERLDYRSGGGRHPALNTVSNISTN